MELSKLVETLINQAEEASNSTCLTITMNTHRMNNEAEQDPVRFKNLLKNARKKLQSKDFSEQQIDQFLEDLENLKNQPRFWQEQDDGLILFVTDDLFHYVKLPFNVDSKVYLDDHFYILPLIRLDQQDQDYFVLALSKNNVRLLKANRKTIEEIELENLPSSYDEFTELDVFETSLSKGNTGANGSAGFHGKGDASDSKQRLGELFIKQVETVVTEYMRKQNAPLLLAGVSDITSHYLKFNHFHTVWEKDTLLGNPDHMSKEEIHRKSSVVSKKKIMNEIYDIADDSTNLINTGRFIYDVGELVKAAKYGQVETLFIQVSGFEFGTFDDKNDQVQKSGDADTEIYNLAATKCLQNSGTVYLLDRDHMPQKTEISAVLRYPVQA